MYGENNTKNQLGITVECHIFRKYAIKDNYNIRTDLFSVQTAWHPVHLLGQLNNACFLAILYPDVRGWKY